MGSGHGGSACPAVGRRLGIALGIGGGVLLAEVAGGLLTGSLALLSDAAHVFLDIFALALSYAALRLASRPPDARYTYGYHRLQVLVALVNGGTLVAVSLGIFREAWERLWEPAPVLAGPMLGVAAAGFLANLVMAWLLHEHDRHDVNLHSAFLHVLGDALGSVGAMAAGVVILFTGWTQADAVVSVLIGFVILVGAVRVLRRSVRILAEGVPEGMSEREVREAMATVPGVSDVHDLHVWTVGPRYVALSAHVVLADQALSKTDATMLRLKQVLRNFGIEHTTIQFECRNCQGTVACLGPLSRRPLEHEDRASTQEITRPRGP